MKQSISLILVGILISISNASYAFDKVQLFGTWADGHSVSYEVDGAHVGGLPKWNGRGEPPLSVSKVIDIALSKIKKDTNSQVASVREIELKHKLDSCVEDKCAVDLWYYKVDAKAGKLAERVSKNQRKQYVILLDGSFVPYKIRDTKTR